MESVRINSELTNDDALPTDRSRPNESVGQRPTPTFGINESVNTDISVKSRLLVTSAFTSNLSSPELSSASQISSVGHVFHTDKLGFSRPVDFQFKIRTALLLIRHRSTIDLGGCLGVVQRAAVKFSSLYIEKRCEISFWRKFARATQRAHRQGVSGELVDEFIIRFHCSVVIVVYNCLTNITGGFLHLISPCWKTCFDHTHTQWKRLI